MMFLKGGYIMGICIGSRIKERRLELKISADGLAKLIGKDRSTVYRYESGEIDRVSSEILIILAKALETTPSYLMGLNTKEEETIATFVSSDGVQIRHLDTWCRELGHIEFTDEENREIIEFAKYLVYKRAH